MSESEREPSADAEEWWLSDKALQWAYEQLSSAPAIGKGADEYQDAIWAERKRLCLLLDRYAAARVREALEEAADKLELQPAVNSLAFADWLRALAAKTEGQGA